MKKINYYLALALTLICFANSGISQPISNYFFGMNAWMPDSIGSRFLNGKLHKKWQDVKLSNPQLIRFGGIAPDKDMPSNYQYIKMIDSVRANGMEPMIQVPFNNNQYTSSQAAAIVKYVNITKGRKIKYWIIGNEPNLVYGYSSAAQVASYLKSFSSAMKAVDPSILIVGPETAGYHSTIINGLTDPGGAADITGKDAAGRYYIDVISYHDYPMGNGSQSTRQSVISKLTSSGGFQDNLTALKLRLDNCNAYHGRTGVSALKMAVTEANINYDNTFADPLTGNGASSFIGGQFWAEIMSIAMKKEVEFINFWSVIEGSNTGYLNNSDGKRKPTYYHFQMLAGNFKGSYCNGTNNQTNVKAFGSKNTNQIAVMILNQEQTTDFNYTIRLNTNPVSGSNPLKININAGVDKEFSDKINNQSSILLVFDASGNILKKIEYKLQGNADANLPPTIIDYSSPTTTLMRPKGPTKFCEGGKVILEANTGAGYTYQWKKENSIITGATTASYTASTGGNYTVEITSGNIITTSNTITINVIPYPTASITPKESVILQKGDSVLLTCNANNGYTYQWEKGNAIINGATTPSYLVKTTGDYSVIITQEVCASESSPVIVKSSDSLSLNIAEKNLSVNLTQVKVYPNPNNGIFTLEINLGTGNDSEKNKNLTLEVFNELGQIVYHTQLIATNTTSQTTVELDKDFSRGNYIVRVREKNNVYDSRIIIVK